MTGHIYKLATLDQATVHIKGKNIFMIVQFLFVTIFEAQFCNHT